jgi:hypothetical protein
MGQHMTAPMATDGDGWTLANVETGNTFHLTAYQNVTDMILIVFSEPSEQYRRYLPFDFCSS